MSIEKIRVCKTCVVTVAWVSANSGKLLRIGAKSCMLRPRCVTAGQISITFAFNLQFGDVVGNTAVTTTIYVCNVIAEGGRTGSEGEERRGGRTGSEGEERRGERRGSEGEERSKKWKKRKRKRRARKRSNDSG